MADEQKPTVEVPAVPKEETAPVAAAEPVAAEAAPAAEATADEAAADEAKPADASTVDETKTDNHKDDVKPVEEGHLSHKAQGASFPKNLIPTKEYFFFGSDAVEAQILSHYQKVEKSVEAAYHNIAWASHTGKGLLFVGDKKAPTGVINLADATEPEVDGSNKFHFTSKGSKHSFKAATTAERDNWVAQLKLKIVEAKELAASVTESDTFKQTLDGFKPVAPAAKDDKPADEAAKADEPKADEAPKEPEAAKEEAVAKEDESKRRSASRKRASFFGFGKKEDKKDEAKTDEATPEAAEPAETDAHRADEAAETEAAATEETAPSESHKDKAFINKRNSFFGGVFSKKEKKATELAKPTEETTEPVHEGEAAVADAAAPVIPPVESTTPLAVDVANTATASAEAPDAAAAEAKKDAKEKRKSSLPFAFGKREKSPSPVDGEEKAGKSAFSKLRATIKGKAAAKAEDKAADDAAAAAAAKDAPEEAAKEEAPAAAEAAKSAEPDAENKPENVATSAPAVTAAA